MHLCLKLNFWRKFGENPPMHTRDNAETASWINTRTDGQTTWKQCLWESGTSYQWQRHKNCNMLEHKQQRGSLEWPVLVASFHLQVSNKTYNTGKTLRSTNQVARLSWPGWLGKTFKLLRSTEVMARLSWPVWLGKTFKHPRDGQAELARLAW